MPDPWTKAALLSAALLCSLCGLAWSAVAMEPHWQQVKGATTAARRNLIALRVLGAMALLASLLICLQADHATMAALVWVQLLAAAVLAVAFTLSWRPRWLAPLVVWLR